MVVLTTPTGHIGSQLLGLLLARDEKVRVVARDASKLGELRRRVEVVEGSHADVATLERALTGANALFHCVPPDFAAPDVDAHYLAFARSVIAATKATGVKHVVTVSALGAHAGKNAGLVSAAHKGDAALEAAGLNVRALWCPGFFENVLRSVQTLREQGVFFGPGKSDVARPYCATKDIAATAAKLLGDLSWSGPGGVAVLGPEDLTLDQQAEILSDALGRPIRYQEVPIAGYKAQMMQYGASESIAQGMIDMVLAKDAGLDLSEPRTAENTTPTTFRAWCTEVLKPMI